jgi:hypothetical protein
MSRFPDSVERHFSEAAPIWDSLKHAIAASSGFQRWQLENLIDTQRNACGSSGDLLPQAQLQELSLDHRVRRYLRETLETLAY